MAVERKARDPDLLDAIDALPRTAFAGSAWRAVRDGRDPTEASSISGRWDVGDRDVVYTSLEADGAIAEVEFHLSRQPVFPSKYRAKVYELSIDVKSVARFDTIDDLVPLGVAPDRYHEILYDATQAIGDAAAFLGFDALIAPNARWPAQNLVLFLEDRDTRSLPVLSETPIDWHEWRAHHRWNRKV